MKEQYTRPRVLDPLRTLARLVVRRKKRAKGPRAAATMTAAGRLGRLAALLLLPALARGWDWKTNVEEPFDCKTHRNPIQLYKEELSVCKGGAEAPSYAPTTDTYAPSEAPTGVP